jgi:hypothetical protein
MALKISSTPTELTNINMPNIIKIEKLLNDSAYRELIEFSSNFNTKLRVERKLRMPFLDPQTGVAQNHSNLFMKKSQRIPGLREGQVYSYPSHRWRNKRELKISSNRPFFRFRVSDNNSTAISSTTSLTHTLPTPQQLSSSSTSNQLNSNTNSSSMVGGGVLTQDSGEASDFQALIDAESNSLTGGVDTDSKDSQEVPKEWYYDDMDANDVASEEQQDSDDFDYSINGYKRKKKGMGSRKSSRKPKDMYVNDDTPPTRKRNAGGSRNASSNSRSSRNKKGSTRSSKGNKNEKSSAPTTSLIDQDPPSFDKVQCDLKFNDNSVDSFAYRKY